MNGAHIYFLGLVPDKGKNLGSAFERKCQKAGLYTPEIAILETHDLAWCRVIWSGVMEQ